VASIKVGLSLVLYTVHALRQWFFRSLIVLRVTGTFFIMAFQFDGKSSGTTPKTRPFVRLDDKDWNPKMEDVEVSSREVNIGTAVSRYDNDPRPDPVTDLKARLSSWGMLNKTTYQQLLTTS
jgi:hypothetical protein